MIFIGNLCEFIRVLVDSQSGGVFLPQNRELVNTCSMVKLIGRFQGRNIVLIGGLNWAVRLLGWMFTPINKVFGSYYYDEPFNKYFDGAYQIFTFEKSIQLLESQ